MTLPGENTPQTWLGRLFAELYSIETRAEHQGWHDGINGSIGNVPLVGGALASAFHWVVDRVYEPKEVRQWNTGADQGDRTWTETLGKFNEAISYVNTKKTELDKTIADMKTNITNSINSLDKMVADTKTNLNNTISSLNTTINQVNDSARDILSHTNSIRDLASRITSLEGSNRVQNPLIEKILRRLGM